MKQAGLDLFLVVRGCVVVISCSLSFFSSGIAELRLSFTFDWIYGQQKERWTALVGWIWWRVFLGFSFCHGCLSEAGIFCVGRQRIGC